MIKLNLQFFGGGGGGGRFPNTGGGNGNRQPTTMADWATRPFDLAKTAPINIPSNATVTLQPKTRYDQIRFRWTDGTYRFEARWHTRTPGAPAGQGNTWVVHRITPGTPTGQRSETHFLTGSGQWTSASQWHAAVQAHQNGTATPAQNELLQGGHWQAP